MAENKKSFLLYCDLIHTVKKMPNDKVGELFMHILEYVNDLEPKTDDLIIQLTFEPIRQSLKRDLEKYERIRLKNKENADKRWNKNNTTECDRIQPNAKNADNDNDSDNVSDSDILLKKETKEENLSKENPTEIFPKSESVEPGAEEIKKVAPKKERREEQLIMPDDFIEIWEEWKEYRKAKRFKSYAGFKWEQMAVDKLLELSNKNPTIAKLILKQTYENSYQGFFPLKQNSNGITNTTNTGFSTSKPSANNGNSGKRSYRQILAERLTNELKANGEGSNITIDAEICE